jgi:predicted MFS family arabinose efflux permease
MSRTEVLVDTTSWRAVLSAFCAVLVGIGLARFAYAPLVPALITENWFSPAEAGYLGATNFAGYLVGAGIAGAVASRAGQRTALRLMMMLASASFFACAAPVSFLWFFAWRFVSGLAGGVLMVLAANAVLPVIAPKRRGFASGVIFTGVGVGIAASGTVVPLLMRLGLSETWIVLGGLASLATLAAWGGWSAECERALFPPLSPPLARAERRSLTTLYIVYGLAAFALVPHIVFLVDYVARGLGAGLEKGGIYWVLFGLGALFGPICAGLIADGIGFRSAIRAVLALAGFAVLLPAASGHPIWIGLSSVLVGAFVPGLVPLILGRVHELIASDEARRIAWGKATMAFAVGQAGGGFLFSILFAQTGGSYALLFALASAALALSFLSSLGLPRPRAPAGNDASRYEPISDRHHLNYPAEDRQ